MKFNKINKGHAGFLLALTDRALIVKVGKIQVEVVR